MSTKSISELLVGVPLPPHAAPQNTEPPDEWEQRRAADVATRVRQSRIDLWRLETPAEYQESDFNHPGLAQSRAQIAQIINWNFGPRGILATGKTGRGKTRALYELYRRLVSSPNSRAVKFWYAGDWFNQLQQKVSFGRDEARGFVEATAEHPILMIDDLGKEPLLEGRSDWAADWLFRLVDLRLGKRLPLIVTTNLNSTGIAGLSHAPGWAEPLLRRLKESCEIVKFD